MIANYIFSRKSVVRCHALGGRFCRTAESNDYRNSVAMATCVLDNLDLWYLYYLYHVCCQHKTLDSSPPMSMQVLRTCTVTCRPRVSTSIHGSTHIVHTMHSCVCVCVATSRLLKCSRIMPTWASQVAGHSSTSNSCSCSHYLMDVSQPQNRLRQTMRSMYGLLTNQLPPHFSNVDFL